MIKMLEDMHDTFTGQVKHEHYMPSLLSQTYFCHLIQLTLLYRRYIGKYSAR